MKKFFLFVIGFIAVVLIVAALIPKEEAAVVEPITDAQYDYFCELLKDGYTANRRTGIRLEYEKGYFIRLTVTGPKLPKPVYVVVYQTGMTGKEMMCNMNDMAFIAMIPENKIRLYDRYTASPEWEMISYY